MLLKHSNEDNSTTVSETSSKYVSLNIVEKVMCDCVHDVGSAVGWGCKQLVRMRGEPTTRYWRSKEWIHVMHESSWSLNFTQV